MPCLLRMQSSCPRGAYASGDGSIIVDGRFGFHSTKALQAHLTKEGFTPGPMDGRFGRRTARSLQTYLRARGYDVGPIDGWCGRKTAMALQMHLKDQGHVELGPVDGWWGRRTTRALQAALNAEMIKASAEGYAPPATRDSSAAPVADATEVADGIPIVIDAAPVVKVAP